MNTPGPVRASPTRPGRKRRIRGSIVRAILQKDLLDVLRDRRTLATMFLVPLVLYPAMVLMLSEAALVERDAAERDTTRVFTVGELPAPVAEALQGVPRLEVLGPLLGFPGGTETSSSGWARRVGPFLPEGGLVLIASSSAATSLTAEQPFDLTLVYDETGRYADRHAERLEEALARGAAHVRDARLARAGLAPSRIVPWRTIRAPSATPAQLGGALLGATLPALLLVFTTVACFYPAVELMAGEKERGTLATLLTAPVEGAEIVLGKYLAVAAIGAGTGLAHVLVLGLTLVRAAAGASSAKLALPGLHAGLVIALLLGALGLAALTAGVVLLTSTFARSFRDANNLMTPILVALTMPTVILSQPSVELTPTTAALPLIGLLLWLKAMLLEKATLGSGLVALASTGTAALGLVMLCIRALDDERVRFSTEGARGDARSLLLGAPEASLGTVLAFVGVSFSLSYFAAAVVGSGSLVATVLVTQLGCIALPTLLMARWMARPDLISPSWSTLTPRSIGAGVLVGLSAPLAVGLPIAWMQAALFPGQAAALEALEALFHSDLSLPVTLLLFAVLPGLVEETAFRGLVLGSLRERQRLGSALLLQALLFAGLHGSLFRLAPTFALGLVLGLLAVRSASLVPGMIAHALSNGLVLTLDRTAGDLLATPTPIVLVGLVPLGVGLVIARSAEPRGRG